MLLTTVASYTVPLSWVVSVKGEEQRLSNGTAFFVRPPRALFAVTAKHVVAGFLAAEAVNPNVVCHLLDKPIALDRSVISLGKNIDIATFRVSEKLIGDLGKQAATGWPAMMPQQGRGIVYAGFPGTERRLIRPREFSFGLYCGGGTAQTIDPDKISSSRQVCYLMGCNWYLSLNI